MLEMKLKRCMDNLSGALYKKSVVKCSLALAAKTRTLLSCCNQPGGHTLSFRVTKRTFRRSAPKRKDIRHRCSAFLTIHPLDTESSNHHRGRYPFYQLTRKILLASPRLEHHHAHGHAILSVVSPQVVRVRIGHLFRAEAVGSPLDSGPTRVQAGARMQRFVLVQNRPVFGDTAHLPSALRSPATRDILLRNACRVPQHTRKKTRSSVNTRPSCMILIPEFIAF